MLAIARHHGDPDIIDDVRTIGDPLFVRSGYDIIDKTPVGKRIRGLKRVKKAVKSFLGDGVQGLIAATRLLKGTEQVGTKEKNVRLFHKVGDFESAMADFNSLKPWLVTKKSYPGGNRLVTGMIGNRLIVVDKKGSKHNPMITVLRASADGVYDSADKVIYYKDSM